VLEKDLKRNINSLVCECISEGKLARKALEKFVRDNNFGSGLRREVADYFYCAVRFYGIFIENPDNFDCAKAYERLEKERSFGNILNIIKLAGFDEKIGEYIRKSISLDTLCELFYRAPLSIRVNSLKTSRDRLLADLLSKGYSSAATEISPFGITFIDHINARQLPEFKKGMFEIQDEASQLIPFCMQIKPGEKILDYCSGYGGKALSIASMIFGAADIFIYDINQKRLATALKRSKIASAKLKKYKNGLQKFDKVLVDVPCSGLGAMRRDADLPVRLKSRDIENFVITQRDIFSEALKNVRQGGYITYSTCSFLKEENEKQVEYFLENHKVKLVDINEILDKKYIHQLALDTFFKTSPAVNGMDCLFAATFQVL